MIGALAAMSSRSRFVKGLNLRTFSGGLRALDEVAMKARYAPGLEFEGGRVTKEAAVNALLLWLADLSAGQVEEVARAYLPRVERALDGVELGPRPAGWWSGPSGPARAVAAAPKPRRS
jgi:hypothetical protein